MNLLIQPKPSICIQCFYFFLHLMALCALIYSPIYFIIKGLLIFFVIVSAYYFYDWVRLKLNNSIIQCYINDDGCEFNTLNGKKFEAQICGDSFISSFLIILNFKISGKFFRKSLILCQDSLNETIFYELKKYLLMS